MSEYTSIIDALSAIDVRDQRILELTAERDAANEVRDFARQEVKSLREALQADLAEFAENYLQSGDEDYRELSELMVNNGLEGLKRTFNVTVRVTYEFEVEVEATDEQAAQDEVDNDITHYAGDNVNPGWDSPYESEFEVSEA